LGNNVEIVVIADYFCGDEGSCWYILDIFVSLGKESLGSFDIDHDNRNSNKFVFVGLFEFIFERLDKVLLEHDDLIVRSRVVEDDHFSWTLFVPVNVSIYTFQSQTQHHTKFRFVVLIGLSSRKDR